ncbi:alpha/beta hydrolase [Lutimonas saemankumensis]|uniref:alpha/beta hydrolase n=1 Tax=Lutimonas saemankumensis TaxID=483016 RepID=UPI001CD5204E|nr:alpha/beta hydrolase [Lutimonas saemankumensis]MCA0932494.1 alpha/beta hydrolase [Lutimonas saemankumensis]
MNKLLSTFLIFTLIIVSSYGQETVRLWSDQDIPNFQLSDEQEFIAEDRNILFIEKVQRPALEIFLPSKRNSKNIGVLILPGGGYSGVAYDWEGTDYAKWLNSIGIAAFVLKYRMPQSESVITSHKAPIQDAQRAIRYIRDNAKKFTIKKNKVGVLGSSAGGHLASTLSTHEENYYTLKDEIDLEDKRPDFQILIYPVISMEKGVTHMGSRNNLLGNHPEEELIRQFSNELHVTENTPASLIIHSGNDKAVPIENSLRYYKALLNKNVATTMHIFPDGGHGYGLGLNNENAPHWNSLARNWLEQFE